jgi:hypothetical protein
MAIRFNGKAEDASFYRRADNGWSEAWGFPAPPLCFFYKF